MLAGADVAVLGLELRRVVADVLQHRPQVLEVEQQQAVVVGDLEHELQHALLGLVEVEHARQQQRPHVADRRAHRMALRAFSSAKTSQSVAGQAAGGCGSMPRSFSIAASFGADRAGLGDAGQVALDVGHEDRHAAAG